MSKTKDLFSPVDVISNGHRNSTIQTTGFGELLEMQEQPTEKTVEVPAQADMVETSPDSDFTEKESAIATEGG